MAVGRRVVAGEYPPGAVLPTELELCAALGVSRPALREGFRLLAAKGMIVGRRKRGTIVQPRRDWNMLDASVLAWHLEQEPNEAYIDGLFEARMVVEPAAAAMAAERASAAEIERIADAFQDMRAAQRESAQRESAHRESAQWKSAQWKSGTEVLPGRPSDEISQTVAADLRFHEAILATCGNHFFASFGALIGSSLTVAFRLNWQAHASAPELSLGQHEAVLRAIRLRDSVQAATCMRALLASAARDARRALARSRIP